MAFFLLTLKGVEGGTPETRNHRLSRWKPKTYRKEITPVEWQMFKPPNNKE